MKPPATVRMDVRGLKADAAEVDALARLALRLQRCGYQLRLLRASNDLVQLIELCGLSAALPAEQVTAGSSDARA